MLTLGDFCPVNKWTETRSVLNHCGIGTPAEIVDNTTGTAYWNRPQSFVRRECLSLAVFGPIWQTLAALAFTIARLVQTVSLAHFREAYHARKNKPSVKQWLQQSMIEPWALTGAKKTGWQVLQIALTVPVLVGLEASALYGIVNPHDGRKLYTSLERFFYGQTLGASTFKPQKMSTGAEWHVVAGYAAFMSSEQLSNTASYLEKRVHPLAERGLFHRLQILLPFRMLYSFYGTSYWLVVEALPHKLTRFLPGISPWLDPMHKWWEDSLGTYRRFPRIFSYKTSEGLLAASGPAASAANAATSIAASLWLAPRAPGLALIAAWNAFIVSSNGHLEASSQVSGEHWSGKDFFLDKFPIPVGRYDYLTMSRMFSIPQRCFVVAWGGMAVAAITSVGYSIKHMIQQHNRTKNRF